LRNYQVFKKLLDLSHIELRLLREVDLWVKSQKKQAMIIPASSHLFHFLNTTLLDLEIITNLPLHEQEGSKKTFLQSPPNQFQRTVQSTWLLLIDNQELNLFKNLVSTMKLTKSHWIKSNPVSNKSLKMNLQKFGTKL
jgi:hypothetical protein